MHEIPERDRAAKGMPINNLIEIDPSEHITAIFVRPEADDPDGHYMLMATRRGIIKKTRMQEYANVRRNGLIAISLQPDDELLWVTPTSGQDELILATQLGKAIRFNESEVRAMGRDTQGVIGMRLSAGDRLAGMSVVKEGGDLLVVSERGYGKRTPLSEYPLHHRAGQGVFTLKITTRVGRLAAVRVVDDPEEEILLITQQGMRPDHRGVDLADRSPDPGRDRDAGARGGRRHRAGAGRAVAGGARGYGRACHRSR